MWERRGVGSGEWRDTLRRTDGKRSGRDRNMRERKGGKEEGKEGIEVGLRVG